MYTPLGTRCCGRPNSLGGGCCTVSDFPQSIVLRCRVTLPFAELRQMFLVDAINLGLPLSAHGVPTEMKLEGPLWFLAKGDHLTLRCVPEWLLLGPITRTAAPKVKPRRRGAGGA